MKIGVTLFVFCIAVAVYSQPIPQYQPNKSEVNLTTSLIIVGDLQLRGKPEILLGRENNAPFVKAICDEIARQKPLAVLILGDLTFNSSKQRLWDIFDELTEPIRKENVTFFPLLGNHEFYGGRKSIEKNYYSRFPFAANREWYSFRWGNTGVITLNSNFDHLNRSERDSQINWYRKALLYYDLDSTISSIIVACHHPPYTNSTVVNDDLDVQKDFVVPFEQSKKTSLFITGHCHAYEHFIDGRKHYVVSGGGGPRQKIKKNDSVGIKHDIFQGEAIRPHHFCKLDPTGDGLLFRMYGITEDRKQWIVIDSMQLGK